MLGKLDNGIKRLTNDELLGYSNAEQGETNFLETGSVFQTTQEGLNGSSLKATSGDSSCEQGADSETLGKIAKMQDELNSALAEVETLANSLEELETNLANKESALKDAKSKLDAIPQKVEDEYGITRLNSQYFSAKCEVEEVQKEYDSAKAEIEKVQIELTKAKEKHTEVCNNLTDFIKSLDNDSVDEEQRLLEEYIKEYSPQDDITAEGVEYLNDGTYVENNILTKDGMKQVRKMFEEQFGDKINISDEDILKYFSISNDGKLVIKNIQAWRQGDAKGIADCPWNFGTKVFGLADLRNSDEFFSALFGEGETWQTLEGKWTTNLNGVSEMQILDAKDIEEINNAKNNQASNNENEQMQEKTQEEAIEASMLSDMQAEISKLQSEIQTTKDSKTCFGALFDGAKGLLGKGTTGELNKLSELQKQLDELKQNPDLEKIQELYVKIFNEQPNLEVYQNNSETVQALSSDGQITLSNGQNVSQEDIANALLEQANSLSANFEDSVDNQGFFTKIASGINSFLGVGTTKNMTKAQIENYQELANKLAQAKDPEEFASLYKAMTGEDLNQESLDQLFSGESKVENSKAVETMMDYEDSNENTKNTAVAVTVGIASGPVGPIAALAIGAGMTVGVNAFDAATQDHGKNVAQNLTDYAKGDLIKDLLVGSLNAVTGKLGNIAGDKLVTAFATKAVGSTAASTMTQEALKGTLKTGQRIATEFVDGALDAGLSSAGEYLIDAAAGKNGNFTNADGNFFNEDGSFAFVNNFDENFDSKDMASQIFISTLLGGGMSVGMQEGIRLVGKGIDKVKNLGDDTNQANPTNSTSSTNSTNEFLFSDDMSNLNAYQDPETGKWYSYDSTQGKYIEDVELESTLKSLEDNGITTVKEQNVSETMDRITQLRKKYADGQLTKEQFDQLLNKEYKNLRMAGVSGYNNANSYNNYDSLQKEVATPSTGVDVHHYGNNDCWSARNCGGIFAGEPKSRASLNVVGDANLLKELDEIMIDTDGMFYYKTPTNVSEWIRRDDPITMYFSQEPSKELLDKIIQVTKKYARGTVVGAENTSTPWFLQQISPTSDMVMRLINDVSKVNKNFASTIKSAAYSGGRSIPCLSAGQYEAAIKILKELMEISK